VIGDRIFGRLAPSFSWDRTPIQGELFGAERLEQHAKSLAATQPVIKERGKYTRLADRLADNAAFLLHANRALGRSADAGHHATPAADWLADNYYLVDMQIREIGVDLRPGFYVQLPKRAAGPFAVRQHGFPNTQSVSNRDRSPVARLRLVRTRHRRKSGEGRGGILGRARG
jgi:hypothetical protein